MPIEAATGLERSSLKPAIVFVNVEGELRRVGRRARRIRGDAGDGVGLGIARPDPAHPALEREVVEHGTNLVEHAPRQSELDEALQPQHQDRHVAHFARTRGDRRRLGSNDRGARGRDAVGANAGPRPGQAPRERNGHLRSPRLAGDLGGRRRRLALGAARKVGQGDLERRRVDQLPLALLDEGSPDRGRQLAAGRVPLVALGAQRLEHDFLELGRRVRRIDRRRFDDSGANDVEQRLAPQPAVDWTSGQDLPEDDAERVEVAPPVERLAPSLLG